MDRAAYKSGSEVASLCKSAFLLAFQRYFRSEKNVPGTGSTLMSSVSYFYPSVKIL